MEKYRALNILLAIAYCSTPSLHCDGCPLYGVNDFEKCKEYTDEKNICEAVKKAEAIRDHGAIADVRCKDCKWVNDMGMSGLYCDHPDNRNPLGCRDTDYCSDGERK